MTFIKDITFGVIHEQVKARERLKNIVVGTLKKNIDEPLTSLISNCEVLKDSDELQGFENTPIVKNLREKLNLVLLESKSIRLNIDDMQDWVAIINGNLKTKNVSFDLENSLNFVQDLMMQRAGNKNLEFIFEAYFDQEEKRPSLLKPSEIRYSLMQQGKKLNDHPLFQYIDQIDDFQILPK